MRIALLVCDHVPAEYQAAHGAYPDMFGELLRLPMDPFHVCDGHFPPPAGYDAFICTGSRCSVYDDTAWIAELKAFTREVYRTGAKFVGVCFGHQMIAEALGGRVTRSAQGFLVGSHTFEVVRPTTWMRPPRATFNVLMMCQDQVDQLPPDSTLLAAGRECAFGMFCVGDRFLGIQGHPEFTPAFNRALFERRLGPDENWKAERALRSFEEKRPNRDLIAGYLRSFLSSTGTPANATRGRTNATQ